MTVATRTSVEWLRLEPASTRSRVFFQALTASAIAAGCDVSESDVYQGRADRLLLWGPGAPNRWPAMQAQIARGRTVVAADLSYWDRDHKVRLSINAPHPQEWVLRRDWPTGRFRADPMTLEDRWDPTGPIVIAGIGTKAAVQYGAQVRDWETALAAQCRAIWPSRPIRYRRKKAEGAAVRGAELAPDGKIDPVLAGASLLITWHSNVAIDALRLGIPVVCRDGAAAALCPSTITADRRPLDPALRARFFHNLAWFQWAPTEARACWAWLDEVLA